MRNVYILAIQNHWHGRSKRIPLVFISLFGFLIPSVQIILDTLIRSGWWRNGIYLAIKIRHHFGFVMKSVNIAEQSVEYIPMDGIVASTRNSFS